MKKYFWGNVLAIDVLQSMVREDESSNFVQTPKPAQEFVQVVDLLTSAHPNDSLARI